MKTRTHFAHRIDMLDAAGEIQEHLAGVEDYELAESAWLAAVRRWPRDIIILRQGARVMRDQPPASSGEMTVSRLAAVVALAFCFVAGYFLG